MSDKLETIKAHIEKLKEEMEVLMKMLRGEEKRPEKKSTRAGAVKRMDKDKAAEDGGGHQSDDNEDSVSIKSEIESDECRCESDDEDYSNAEVKEELPDQEDAAAPAVSTSRGQKRQATPERNIATKKRRVDTERQESASGSGNFKVKVLGIDCIVGDCQSTFHCAHKMREHLLAVHKVKPIQCHAQGCGQQFDTRGELRNHSNTYHRTTVTWLCPDCPRKRFTSGYSTRSHISDCHLSGQFQCNIGQCQFIATTRRQVRIHQQRAHPQHTCPFDGCTRSFRKKSDLTRHQRTHTSFHCTFIDCGYVGKFRHQVVQHIRTIHFKLPTTVMEQHRRGIIEDRNPNDFIGVHHDALRPDPH